MHNGDDTRDETDGDLSAAPRHATDDTLEAILQQAVAAPAAYPALSSGTLFAGRYEVERMLGAGGMGMVYLARDRTLDRPVALKLHRVASEAGRMHREAIAMARLAHPNVVTVFEVGELDGRGFVAMEYVPGTTLRGWLLGATRKPREILATLLAAGEGLAAAHDGGLVHRDVKPDNIFVGSDGRVRIGDFGLAQLPRSTSSPGPVRVAIGGDTATGTVVGTPAYMAPEQIEGGELDARTDQFAFCVAVWEALGGERPFGGANTEELRDAIARGDIRSASRIPARLRRVLLRGMALRPDARWPSLRQLLAALRSAERRPRVIAGAAAGAIALAGLIGWIAWPERDPAAACADAGAEAELVIPASLADAAAVAAGRGGPDGADAARRIRLHVDQYRDEYRQLAGHACTQHARGQWSAELLAASRECAGYHAHTARELLLAAPHAATQPSEVGQIVNLLPTFAPCQDPRILASWRLLMPARDALDEVIAARARLDAANTLVELGQLAVARATRDAIAAAPIRTSPAVARRLDLLRGKIALAETDLATAEQLLTEVYFQSRAQDDGTTTLAAAAGMIDLTGRARRDYPAAQRWIRDGIAEAERLKTLSPGGAFTVFVGAARIIGDIGDTPQALELAARAEALHPEDGYRKISLLAIRANAHTRAGKISEALSTTAEMLALTRQVLGPSHPKTAELLSTQAALLLESGREQQAVATAQEAAAILARSGNEASSTVATVEMNLGATLLRLNDPAAVKHLERARAILVSSYGENHPDIALLDTNLALVHLDRHEVDTALAMLRHATAIQERVLGAHHEELADGLYNLAVAEREAGKLDDALATARRCADIFAQVQPGSQRFAIAQIHLALIQNLRKRPAEALAAAETALAAAEIDEGQQTAAWARLEAARALIDLHRDPARARTLLGEARTRYTAEHMPERVAQIDGLLARLR